MFRFYFFLKHFIIFFLFFNFFIGEQNKKVLTKDTTTESKLTFSKRDETSRLIANASSKYQVQYQVKNRATSGNGQVTSNK